MKIAVIGAGRSKNGIGPYIANYFQKKGARVVAVLGANPASARNAAAALVPFGVEASPYADFAAMLRAEKPEAVAIASPAETHHAYLTRAVAVGVHVFCEKPFVWPGPAGHSEDVAAALAPLFARAAQCHLKIAMNSQWPFSLPYYEALCGPLAPASCREFFVHLSPVVTGRAMILDSAPHALSLLYAVLGPGKIEALTIDGRPAKMVMEFLYRHAEGVCAAAVHLCHAPTQPREFSYGFNGKIVRRLLEPATYAISFATDGKTLEIADPLALSVADFLAAVAENREPRVGKDHILCNMKLLREIYQFSETI